MTFVLPQTPGEALLMLVPAITLLIGIVHLLMPRTILKLYGLEPKPGKPDAIAEIRASYGGVLIAVGLGALLFQEPLALQPGLNHVLALGWLLAFVGYLFQIIFDGARSRGVVLRFLFAGALGILGSWSSEVVDIYMGIPIYTADMIFMLVALLTTLLGAVAFFVPGVMLKLIRLQPVESNPAAKGEIRGLLAGFFLAIGIIYIAVPSARLFVGLELGAVWMLTSVGRLVSVIFDRASSLYNWLAIIFEFAVGAVLLGFIFGYI
ncbi:MAG: DUF4345 family protein [Pseudomonadota bacterium]